MFSCVLHQRKTRRLVLTCQAPLCLSPLVERLTCARMHLTIRENCFCNKKLDSCTASYAFTRFSEVSEGGRFTCTLRGRCAFSIVIKIHESPSRERERHAPVSVTPQPMPPPKPDSDRTLCLCDHVYVCAVICVACRGPVYVLSIHTCRTRVKTDMKVSLYLHIH